MFLSTRRLADQPELRGVMVTAMVVLAVFGYPFFELFYGAEGLAHIAIYDVGNGIYAGTGALWTAMWFGSQHKEKGRRGAAFTGALKSPLLWAAIAGVVGSLLAISLDGPVGGLLKRLATANTPLAMIAVGIFLRPRVTHIRLVAHYVLLRMVVGGILGWLLGLAFGFTGLPMITAAVAASLPAGTTCLIYAGNEGLDTEFAASLVSSTVVLGAIIMNTLPHLLAAVYL